MLRERQYSNKPVMKAEYEMAQNPAPRLPRGLTSNLEITRHHVEIDISGVRKMPGVKGCVRRFLEKFASRLAFSSLKLSPVLAP